MNLKYRRVSAAALALVFCLAVTPVAIAKPAGERFRFEPRDPIVRIVKKIKNFLTSISSEDDFPEPPRP
jgi:hypothetical protein